MLRTLRLKPDQVVLDLGCGKGVTSAFMVQHHGVHVVALDLWTSAEELDRRFTELGLRERVQPLRLDATQPLPFAHHAFDAIFSMNSFSFYGGSHAFLAHLLPHLKPGGQLCIGSEALTTEFTAEQLANPPEVYAFRLPPPHEDIDVFADDFSKQHTAAWWRRLFETSGLLEVETCFELDDADILYGELVRYEHQNGIDSFDVQVCLDQIEWGRTHQPAKTLFVLTARKLPDHAVSG
jgi:SAM-dependent methyltransferase